MKITKLCFIFAFLLGVTSVFCQTEVKNFRGALTRESDGVFFVLSSGLTKDSNAVYIHFSKPINPRTFSGNTIFINGKPLSSEQKITFGRDGASCRILLLQETKSAEIILDGIKSFLDETLERTSFTITLEN